MGSYHLASAILRDSAGFTVDHPGFSTRRLTGPSMLTVDGAAHTRHRAAFAARFRRDAVDRLGDFVHRTADRLVRERPQTDELEVRGELAQPLAVATLREALTLQAIPTRELTDWYLLLREAFENDTGGGQAGVVTRMRSRLHALPHPGLSLDDYVGNVCIMLLGGIETVEGMICHAVVDHFTVDHRSRDVAAPSTRPDAFLEESLRRTTPVLRLDRYATADCTLAGQPIHAGDLVIVDLEAANLDPSAFTDPETFDTGRAASTRHLSFAVGPHHCLGVHLARLESRAALTALHTHLPDAFLDHEHTDPSTGSIFRKPARVTLCAGQAR